MVNYIKKILSSLLDLSQFKKSPGEQDKERPGEDKTPGKKIGKQRHQKQGFAIDSNETNIIEDGFIIEKINDNTLKISLFFLDISNVLEHIENKEGKLEEGNRLDKLSMGLLFELRKTEYRFDKTKYKDAIEVSFEMTVDWKNPKRFSINHKKTEVNQVSFRLLEDYNYDTSHNLIDRIPVIQKLAKHITPHNDTYERNVEKNHSKKINILSHFIIKLAVGEVERHYLEKGHKLVYRRKRSSEDQHKLVLTDYPEEDDFLESFSFSKPSVSSTAALSHLFLFAGITEKEIEKKIAAGDIDNMKDVFKKIKPDISNFYWLTDKLSKKNKDPKKLLQEICARYGWKINKNITQPWRSTKNLIKNVLGVDQLDIFSLTIKGNELPEDGINISMEFDIGEKQDVIKSCYHEMHKMLEKYLAQKAAGQNLHKKDLRFADIVEKPVPGWSIKISKNNDKTLNTGTNEIMP